MTTRYFISHSITSPAPIAVTLFLSFRVQLQVAVFQSLIAGCGFYSKDSTFQDAEILNRVVAFVISTNVRKAMRVVI